MRSKKSSALLSTPNSSQDKSYRKNYLLPQRKSEGTLSILLGWDSRRSSDVYPYLKFYDEAIQGKCIQVMVQVE